MKACSERRAWTRAGGRLTVSLGRDGNKAAGAWLLFFALLLNLKANAANLIWINPAGGDWNVATNWSPNLVPGSNDNATIASSVTVTVNSPAECSGLILGNGTGSAPTIAGSSTLTLHGASIWRGPTFSGSGRTIIETGATLDINEFGLFLNSRILENGGTISWKPTSSNIGFISAVITNRPGALFDSPECLHTEFCLRLEPL